MQISFAAMAPFLNFLQGLVTKAFSVLLVRQLQLSGELNQEPFRIFFW